MEIFYQKHFAAHSSRLEQTAVVAAIRLLYRLQRIRQLLLGSTGVGSVG
jgi:hypothetical protein